ncbi:hypothetical protein M7I_1920 [Glarea lozoyensis 74030]|uniref:Uncharacterized protein n=1 Tax=Glarea lozoyensis (strain ATCC 74030 / MF5533) TaxID=1104152 RepID=H0EHE2_GLAL7|nr:hypothetical protein M7I_1920 [Glarea lozoyensis 74030]
MDDLTALALPPNILYELLKLGITFDASGFTINKFRPSIMSISVKSKPIKPHLPNPI